MCLVLRLQMNWTYLQPFHEQKLELIFCTFLLSPRCSNVTDLIVGADKDDDSSSGGGYNIGAVYIIFLHRDGTVKSEQKISSTHGGLSAPLDDKDLFGISVAGVGDINDEYVTSKCITVHIMCIAFCICT